MDLLLSRYRNMTALVLAILAQLVLLAWQVKSGQDVRLIRVWAVTAVTPLARVLEFAREHTIGVAEDYLVLVNVRTENQRLQEELGRIRMENQFLRNELSTADRVRALQSFQEQTPSRTLPARIIGTGTGANARVVFVDQGSAKGVMRGMAVVTPDGIVGKVLAAYPTASQVLLITDETFAAGVISEKNRVHGTVKGIGQSKVIVQYVQNEEKVEAGEMFYTSGDDRVFPKGMPVGRVTVVRNGSPFKEIFLVPSAFQQGLEEVLIVIEGVHGQIPGSQTAAAPGVYLTPPVESPRPERAAAQQTPAAGTAPAAEAEPVLTTEADRLRERYKRIGEAQGHKYGEPAGRVPNFNVDPDAARTQPGISRPADVAGTAETPAGETPALSRTPVAGGTGAVGAPASSTITQTPAPRPLSQGSGQQVPAGTVAAPVKAPARADSVVTGGQSTVGTTGTTGPTATPPRPQNAGTGQQGTASPVTAPPRTSGNGAGQPAASPRDLNAPPQSRPQAPPAGQTTTDRPSNGTAVPVPSRTVPPRTEDQRTTAPQQ